MQVASRSVVRRVSLYGVLLLILGFATVSLTQCTMTDDNVTGISLADAKSKPDKCLKECGKAYDKATKEEFRINHKNRKKCDGDPVCLALEQERHRDALAEIEADYTNCRGECHHQGGGGTR
jgi:hypothetical protein